VWLRTVNVLGFQPFVTGNDFERDHFTLVQSFEPPAHDRRVMHEYVLPGIIGDKAKPFFVIEPLNFTTCHIISPEGLPDAVP
jgi:hypothetical protein